MKLIVGMTGASGSILGIRLLEAMRSFPTCETHLVLSEQARQTLTIETTYSVGEVEALAHFVYSANDFGAAISSGSFRTDGMVIMPCTMKTLAGIASGFSDNLVLRAADVCLKERRKLVLVPREAPLSAIHLENMLKVTQCGAVVIPAVMTFYNPPAGVTEMTNYLIGKVLMQFGLELPEFRAWQGKQQ